MISAKLHAQQLAALLLAGNITDVLLSPGSRNGPLIHTISGCESFDCRVIVDERSAGYFALGVAQATGKPVVLICSSGTATLNLSPAVAEAFYLKIPLIVITADRPDYWIDQLENQSLHQQNLYRNFIRKSCSLPLGESEEELWFGARMISESLNAAKSDGMGPVHINIPFEEPLHKTVDMPLPEVKIIEKAETERFLNKKELKNLGIELSRSEKILVLAGQSPPNPDLSGALADFAEKTGAIVAVEHLSNTDMQNNLCCRSVEPVIRSFSDQEAALFQPDLLITCCGHVVSRSIKQFLRTHRPRNHYHIAADGGHTDTYKALTKIIDMEPELFFKQAAGVAVQPSYDYAHMWKHREAEVREIYNDYIKKCPFSDLSACEQVLRTIPENSAFHLGNSSTVRYALMSPEAKGVRYMGNRGTSGIDGSLSTAVGYGSCTEKINSIILGDLSFFYDSNGLWNKYTGKNLRIILLNNGGGNIFSFVEGLAEDMTGRKKFEEYFFAGHNTKAENIAAAFGLDYLHAASAESLKNALDELYAPARTKAALLEIFTKADTNTAAFKGLLKKTEKRK